MNTLQDSERLNQEIESIIKEASSLREVTYSYIDLGNDRYFNETIFIDFLGSFSENFPKDADGVNGFIRKEYGGDINAFCTDIKHKTEKKLENRISFLEQYIETDDVEDKDSLELLIAALKFTKNGLDFELEEVGYDQGLSESEIHQKIQIQKEYDKELFGEHVSEDLEFLKDSYAYLQYLEDTHGSKIDHDKLQRFQEHKKIILSKISEIDPKFTIEGIPVYTPEVKDKNFQELKNIKIPRKDYKEIFDMYFEIAGVPQRGKIGNYGSFYDGDEVYGIPSTEAYAYKTLEELLRLCPHETTHYVNLQETRETGQSKRKGDMLKEEGLAMFIENLVSGVKVEDMNYMTFAGPSVVIAALATGSDYEDFQGIYDELLVHDKKIGSKGNTKQKALRKKRGFHKYYPGGPNKDSTYALGLKKVLEYVKGGGNLAALFGGKISMDDVESGKYTPERFGNKYINHILLSELIFFYLGHKRDTTSEESLHDRFTKYLQDKYSQMLPGVEIFSETEMFTFAQKRLVAKILKRLPQEI